MSRKIMLTLGLLLSSIFVLSAVTLDGMVIDGAAGEPVVGALLQLHQGPNEVIEAESDENGQFIFTDLETGNYMLHVEAAEFEPFMEMVELEEDMTLTIELQTGVNPGELTGHLYGIVSYEDGTAAAGLEMEISTWNQNSQPHHLNYETVTAEDGSYDFAEILDFVDYEVMVMVPMLPFTTEVVVEGETEFNFTLEEYIPGETYSLSGTVSDGETGEFLPGIEVRLHGMQGIMQEAITDEAGNYLFAEVFEGVYNLTVSGYNSGYEQFTAEVEIVENTVFDIELVPVEQGELSLSGVITDAETGEAITGIIINIHAGPGMHYDAVSAEDGSYLIEGIFEGIYSLNAMSEEMEYMHFQTEIEILEDTVFNIQMQAYVAGDLVLTGTITAEETGEPLPGITVHLFGENMPGNMFMGISDENGYYVIEGIVPGIYQLTIMGMQGMVLFEEEIEIVENMTYDIVLGENQGGEGSLSGVVINAETGEFIPGVEILLQHGGEAIETVSGEAGNYSFENIGSGNYHVIAGLNGFLQFNEMIGIEGDVIFDIILVPFEQGELSLSGVVTDAETGDAIPGIIINLHAGPGMHHSAVSAEDGSYLIEGLFEGIYSLYAMSEEMVYMHFQTEIEILEDTVFDIQLQPYVAGELVLSGTITSEETGEPLSDIIVHLFGENIPGNMLIGVSDENGYYMIEGISPGIYQLLIMGMQGMVLFEEEIEIVENMTYDIVLGENQGGEGSLSGVVINAETGEFIPGVTVFLTHGWETLETVTDEEGNFAFMNIAAGNYHVIAAMEGYQQFNEMIEIDGDVVIDIVLVPYETGDYSLSGTVTDSETGDIIPGVHVQVFGQQGQPGSDVTNEAGYYEISGLYEGVYQLMAWTNGWDQYEPFDATIDIFGNIVFNFELVPFELPGSGSVSGTVYDADTGNVIADAFIELSSINGGNPGGGWWWNHYNAVTDENGVFVIENVETGEYILSAEAEGYLISFYDGVTNPEDATVISIEENSQIEIEMSLTPLVFYSVSGTVMDYVNEVPLAEAAVRAMMPGTGCNQWAVVESITDENGNYTMEVPQGDYIFVAEFGQQGPGGDMMRQFYDHKQSPANADVVAVAEDISGIDFDLAMQEDYDNSISGTITVDGAVPENPVLVAAVAGGGNHWEAACVTDMFGNYILENLPEGDYYILAYEYNSVPTYYPGVIDFQDAENVHALGNVANIDFDLIVPETNGIYQANGYVLNDNGDPVANANVVILNENETVLGYAVTNNDGYYLVDGLPTGNLTGIATKVLYESDEEPVNMTTTGTADFVINPETTTDAPEDGITPAAMTLSNYPNPFNPVTTISFAITDAGYTTLNIYNISGQKIATLVAESLTAGVYNVSWNGTANSGSQVASGMYFYRLQSGGNTVTNKMVLMK
ncbi:MAG: carboxypeptidase regulatory-like domain-containing protein [Candidatus Cloacimonetes bacterium]|nr:carboxypeptidase regulatory-like domain-containing protein [Candidatus Cloacimonadota bacterium]